MIHVIGYRKLSSQSRSRARSLLDATALGVILAVVDSLLHSNAGWTEAPLQLLHASSWFALAYVAGILLLSAVLRRRSRVAFVAMTGFALAQATLWLHRSSFGGSSLLSWIGLITLLSVLLIGWPSARLARRIPAGSRATLVVVASAVVAGAVWLLWPIREPAGSFEWPEPVVAQHGDAKANVLLITLDTVRRDHLGAYGYEGIETQHFDSLAAQGALFLRGIAQAPITPVSHASILNGMLPAKHGLRAFSSNNVLSREYPLLSELLQEAGYTTGALVAATPLHTAFGLDRGFHVYQVGRASIARFDPHDFERALLPSALRYLGLIRGYTYRDGSRQTDDAIRWIQRYSSAPFFLWVHYFDAHMPYNLHPEFGRPAYHRDSGFLSRFSRRYRYDSEIMGVDGEIGRIMSELRDLGLLDRTIVAVVSDHGEGLGDHGYGGHLKHLFGEQLNQILSIRYPAAIEAGTRVESQVRSTDVMPSILDLLGLEAPAGLDGVTLVPLLEASADPEESARSDRVAFSETHPGKLVAVSDGRYKMIRSLDGREWVFDQRSDPLEERNLAGSLPEIESKLRALLASYVAIGDESGIGQELDEELIEKLKALGYIN